MFALLRTLSLGYLGQHRTRSVLVVLSIALGVAVLVATRSLSHSLNKAAARSIDPLAGLADLLVVNGESGVPRKLGEELKRAQVPGLRDVQPVVIHRVKLADLNNRAPLLVGTDWHPGGAGKAALPLLEKSDSPVQVHMGGDWRDLPDILRGKVIPVLVGEELSGELAPKLPPGSKRFKVRASGREWELASIGTVSCADPRLPINRNMLFTDVANASRLAFPQAPDYVSQLNLVLEPGADRAAVQQRVREVVGGRAEVQTPEASQGMFSDVMAGLELGASVGGIVALVIGLFLVYNALSVSVAERRHDIGILRSVGATRPQVAGLFIGEAALLGLVGSALGLPIGYGMARLVLGPARRILSELLVPIESGGIEVTVPVMVVAVLAGTATAVLAALAPALHAASEEPADAVRRVPLTARPLVLLLQLGAGGLLLVGGLAFVMLREYLPIRAGAYGGIVCVLVSALVFTPLLAGLAGRLLQPVFRYLLGLEGRLAADNLVRSPGRTGLVIAALAATGALLVQMAGFLHSTEEAIHAWVEDKIGADLFVTSGSSLTNAGYGLTMSDRVGREIQQALGKDGVEAAVGIRGHRIDYNHLIVILLALDTRAFGKDAAPHHSLARTFQKLPLTTPGNAAVSENFAALHHVAVGDEITIPGRAGPVKLKVVGTVIDYTWKNGTVIVDREWYRKEFADDLVDVYDVYLRPGADAAAVRRAIEDRWGKEDLLFTATRAELHREVSAQLRRVYGLAYAQPVVVGLVSLLGVISALFISVLQRRRELGLLRAVGASRAQVLRSVLAEAILMGLVGAVVGFGVGLVLEWYVINILVLDESGFLFPVLVPWAGAAVVFGLSIALATLAGLWPAWQATRLRITEAIAYE